MSGIEIGLLIAGAAFIIIGNMFAEKKSNNAGASTNGKEIWSEKDEVTIKDRVNIVLSDKSEQIINETDDTLCHLSNEKIMEFQEFADQLLEKLNENHNQTVFMYKMLTDKQTEMKECITDMDARFTAIKNELNEYSQNFADSKNQHQIVSPDVNNESDSDTDIIRKTAAKEKIQKIKKEPDRKEAAKKEAAKSEPVMKKETKDNVKVNESKAQTALISNKNEKILELYDSGKSIVEVSKVLGIGQGEVKLVVGLYRGKK